MVKRSNPAVYVGCAGWSLPSAEQSRFPARGTHLARYAARFPAVEINSSFYRRHRPATYAKWAASVPAAFRFSVKIPQTITHERRLDGSDELLRIFIGEVTELGAKLGCLLVQLPPSFVFPARIAKRFFATLRKVHAGAVVLEPRHATWFAASAEHLLKDYRISRVAADPAPVPAAAKPAGWQGIAYYRLHGSPRRYYSSYTVRRLATLSDELASIARPNTSVWCVFDNTAAGAAVPNAFDLMHRLDRTGRR
jgi:uncharacterized protein YecE (DUF72 family)